MATDYSWLYGENKVMNVTIINGNVSEEMPGFLEGNFANESLSRDRIFGKSLGRAGAMPHSHLSLRRFEPVYHHWRASRLTGKEETKENTVCVFQSLNGVYVDPRCRPEQFRSEFRCAGMSMTDYDFDHGEQTPSGVAVAIAGSMDIVNNSPYTWRPGDRLIFATPPLDKAQYSAFRESMPPIEGEDKGRVRFIITPVRFVQARLWFEATLTQLFASDGHTRFVVDRLFDADPTTAAANGDPNNGSEFRAANHYVTFIRSIMYVTIASLVNAGVRDISLPGVGYGPGGANVMQKQAYNNIRDQLDKDLNNIANAPPGGISYAAHQANVDGIMRSWQLLLGLVPIGAMGPDSDQRPAQTLVQFVVGCVSRNALLSPEFARYHDILNLFSDAAKANAQLVTQTGNGYVKYTPNLEHRLGAISHIISSSLGGTLRAIKESVEEQQNAYVATANSVTEPSNPGSVRRS